MTLPTCPPDASPEAPFLQPLISGSHEVSFEQFQADLEWTTRWSEGPVVSPIVDAVGQVLRSGGAARGMLDGSWYNLAGNTEVAEYLSAEALAAGVDPSFGFMPEGTPVSTLHNKGLVLDDACVVSSNNWVYASFARNRELAVEVRSAGAKSYFMDAYELDRVPDTCAPVADAGEDVVADVPGVVMLDASGSWDDRAIADISWDFEGDGHADAEGPRAEFAVSAPGTYEVWVWVTDAWGNSATDSVNVSVGLAVGADGASGDVGFRVPWPLPAAVAALAVVIGAARKLNLLHSVTRGKG